MAIYTTDIALSDVIFAHPEILPVVNRLGLYLGVGDMSIGELCAASGTDTGFFLAIVNTYLNADYHPASSARDFSIDEITDYLEKTDAHYARALLPNIERHFNSLLAHSPSEGNNLSQLRHFFTEMKMELTGCIEHDREVLFPSLRMLGVNGNPTEYDGDMEYGGSWQGVEEKIDDLASFFIRHLRGDYDANLCMAVVTAVMTLGRDVAQNNRIRERMLRRSVEKRKKS